MYLLNTKDDIDIGEIRQTAKEILSGSSEVIMSIAEKLRQEGKLEGEKELVLKILNQRFGGEFNKELEGKIRKANEEEINKIKKNILKVTIKEMKELLK